MEHIGRILLFSLFIFVVPVCAVSTGTRMESILIEKVLQNYEKNAMPQTTKQHRANVYFGMALNQLIALDERSQIITLKTWYRYRWHDYRLTWEPAEYNYTTDIRLFANRIWQPDITFYSDVREEHDDVSSIYPAEVFYNGTVVMNLPMLIKSYCRLNVQYFPYDIQVCELKFSSWTYSLERLNLINMNDSADLSVFEHNGEWKIVKAPCKRREMKYECCPDIWPDVTFWLVLERRPLYYIFNLVLPCIFITATTILVFYMPPEGGEKVSLSVTVLLATTVFLLLVAESMPPQSEVIPLIGQYFAGIIILMATSTAFTVVVINLHYRGSLGTPVPRWMHSVILEWLAYFVCMRPVVKAMVPPVDIKQHCDTSKPIRFTYDGEYDEPNFSNTNNKQMPKDHQGGTNDFTITSTSEMLLAEILQTLRSNAKDKKDKKDDGRLRSEWMAVALVVDRFFMIVFFVITLVLSVALLVNKPSANSVVIPD